MKLELKGIKNPLTDQGIRALAIVLGVIVVIAGMVYVANLGKRTESSVLPATTVREATATPQLPIPTEIPTIAPFTEGDELLASPSPAIKVRKPTGTATSVPTL